MILTFKVKHSLNFSDQLEKAKQVAEFAVRTGCKSSKDVKHFGLPSAISNQVLRKYGRGTCKKVSKPILPVPGQSVRLKDGILSVSCLKLRLPFKPHKEIIKVNQVEVNADYVFVSCTVLEEKEKPCKSWIGVDLNTTGHCAVIADPQSGKVIKLGKKAAHLRAKARATRRNLQKKGKFRRLKSHRNKEQRRLTDLDHKVSKAIVDTAVKTGSGIRMENLTGIKKTTKQAKSFKGALHSWSFYRLQSFVEYKAKLQGVPFEKIDPSYTSQADSRTGLLGTRTGKRFVSPTGRVDHADANAAFNIALAFLDIDQLRVESDARKGSLKPLKAQRSSKRSDARTPRL